MPLKHACFVSYVHDGANDVDRRVMCDFVTQFVQCLDSSLAAYAEPECRVFIDRERLRPGYRFNEAIARAMCQSACWIMVFVPRYADHQYCRREFLAMLELQRKRSEAFAQALDPICGQIFPIILRGKVDCLPAVVRDHTFLSLQFKQFITSSARLAENEHFNRSIEGIATATWNIWRQVRHIDLTPLDCSQYRLPADDVFPADDERHWPSRLYQPFPGRD